MNTFDHVLLSGLSGWTGHFWKLDFTFFSLSDNDLFKGGVFMALIWALWFREDRPQSRKLVISTLFGATLAVLISKAFEHLLPLRLRPYEAGLAFIHFPYDMGMEDQTSFPSDHSTLFSALALGLCFSSRKLGIAAFIYAALVIFLPRVYLGLHYPTDILSGAMIGITAGLFAQSGVIRRCFAEPVAAFACDRPGIFYPLFFLVTFQMATLFDGLRDFVRLLGIVS